MVARSNRARPTTKDKMNQALTISRSAFFMPKISRVTISSHLKKTPQQLPTIQALISLYLNSQAAKPLTVFVGDYKLP